MKGMKQRLRRIAHTFAEVNRTYFEDVIPTPTFVISKRLTHTAGRVLFDTWTMEISEAYHDHHGWEEELVYNVKHESIHLYLDHMQRPHGHTKEFKTICTRIGATLHCKSMPRRRPQYCYRAVCPRCKVPRYLRSWRHDLACGACCDDYNGGEYTPEFTLRLIKRENVEEPRRAVNALLERFSLDCMAILEKAGAQYATH